MKKYQPSNGTEMGMFTERYCMQCRHCNPDPEGKKQCELLGNAFAYSVDDEGYPSEWVVSEDGPKCTKHEKWNWQEMGDPDDPENPNYIMPFNPDQLTIF